MASSTELVYDDLGLPEAEEKDVGGYRALAVFALLFAIGGLFIGCLAQWAEFLLPAYYGGSSFLPGSVLSGVIDYFKALFELGFGSLFEGSWSVKAMNLANFAAFSLPCVAVLCSLVCFIVALASRNAAEKCGMFSAIVVFLSYFVSFAWALLQASVFSGVFAAELFDASTGIIAGAAFLLLMIAALARRKALGLCGIVETLLMLCTVFAMVYPGSLNTVATAGVLHIMKDQMFYGAATLFLLAMLAFNVIASVSRMGKQRVGIFDCVRYGLLLLGVALYLIAALVDPSIGGNIFTAAGQLMPVILLISAPVAAFLLVIIIAVVSNKKEAQEEEETEAPAEVPAEARTAERTAEEPPISEFERTMTALARGEQPAEPVREAEPAPSGFFAQHAQQPVKAPSYFEVSSQYTYDPFINTLTPQEKNEFGDLFIAGKYGDLSYLPAYVIGGNNEEFFRKVFVYLGRFRKNISSPLLEKLYLYISRN